MTAEGVHELVVINDVTEDRTDFIGMAALHLGGFGHILSQLDTGIATLKHMDAYAKAVF